MFYYKLLQLCKQKNITITALVGELGMSTGNLSKWKNGGVPKMDTVTKFAEYFSVSTDYFFMQSNESPDLLSNYGIIPLGVSHKIPVLGVIRAGAPVLADEHIEGYEYCEVNRPQDYFYLRVQGDSMINAGIYHNSLVLIKKQNTAENGQIVACLLDNECATLKRFKCKGKQVSLNAENPSYPPILVNIADFENNTAKILGVAVEVKTKLT